MLWEICQAEFFPRNLRLRSPITRVRYFQAIGRFGEFLGRAATFDDLDDDVFACWLLWLVDHKQVCERTANGIVGRLRTLWTFLAKRGKVPRFPSVQKLPEPEMVPRAWSREELQSLFEAAGRMPGRIEPFTAAIWWQALLSWYWCTGERLGATLAMEWQHVDLARGVASLPARIRKGRLKAATYQLWPDVVAALSAIQRPCGNVFPWHGCIGTYFNHYGRLLRLAGLPTGRYRKSQAMRVSFATWTEALGGNATRKLQHGSRATTEKHYLDKRFLPSGDVQLFKPWDVPPETKAE